MALNAKQERFCQEFLVDLNATQAAIRAGYSEKTAKSQGSRLLTKADVSARVGELKAERAKRTEITADRVLRELARVAFVDPTDVLNMETATVKPDVSADDRAVIAAVKVKYIPVKQYDEDGELTVVDAVEREVKLADKLRALDMLAKHLNMYDKERQQDGGEETETGVVVMPEAMQPTEHPALDGEDVPHE